MRLGVWIIYILFAYCRKVKKSFEENLGMGEWAPLPPCRSSATPSRLLHPGGGIDANDSYLYSVDANDYRLCLVMRMICICIRGFAN